MPGVKQQCIAIHFLDKRRDVMRTGYMPAEEAESEFTRALRDLEESEGSDDRWIRLRGVVVRASEVAGIQLETLPTIRSIQLG